MALKDWDVVAANNTAKLAGISTDGSVMTMNQTDNAFREVMAQLAAQVGKVGYEGADIASASPSLANATGWAVDITGTTTITAFGTVDAGQEFILRFTGALILTHNATTLILPGAANITTVAGDVARMKSEGGGNWRCTAYMRASSLPVTLTGTETLSNKTLTAPTVTGTLAGAAATFSTTLSVTGAATFAAQMNVALGSVGTPTYSFTGDLNTGIWSPSADVVAVSAGGAETARLSATGLLIGLTAADFTAAGTTLYKTGFFESTVSASAVGRFNRLGDDGSIVSWLQASVSEGSVSISGTTVTYGSFCASHESQLSIEDQRGQLLRGTVIETVDELCDWYGRDDEILAKCKISDTAGSRSVYGVFFDWYDSKADEDTLNVASGGAFVIRIAKGVTVQKGDLIESNGDGCGRVQADDTIRASTIGKVLAGIAVKTYKDGSKLFPCALYCG